MSDRRRQTDRRSGWIPRRRDRRRIVDDRALVVEVGNAEIRVAALSRDSVAGTDSIEASTARWRRTSAGLGSPDGVAELATALREAAKRHNVLGAGLHILVGGALCTTRVVRGTNESVRAELAQIQQRSRLYLALGPGPKIVVSAARQIDARHQHALALICNQTTLDAISHAAEMAGLPLVRVESALSAMNRALARIRDLPSDPYLMVHIDEESIEIGVCHQGELLLDYRPAGSVSHENLAQVVCDHLNRLRRHAGHQLNTPPAALTRLYLLAPEERAAAAVEQFTDAARLEVQRVVASDIPGTWSIRPNEAAQATLATLGGVIGRIAPSPTPAPDMMQHILDRTREPLQPILIRSGAPLAAVLLIAIGLWSVANHYQKRLVSLERAVDQLAAAQGRASELRLTSLAAEAKLAHMHQLAKQLPGHIGGDAVRLVGQCLPSDVWLSRLDVTDVTSLHLQGASYNVEGVYDFVRWLELAPQFVEPALKGTSAATSSTGPVTGFDVESKLALAATKSVEGANP